MAYFCKKASNITKKCYFTYGYLWVRSRCMIMAVELHKYLKAIVLLATQLLQNWKQGGILFFSLFLIFRGILVLVVPIIQIWWIAVSKLCSEFYNGMIFSQCLEAPQIVRLYAVAIKYTGSDCTELVYPQLMTDDWQTPVIQS